MKISDFKNVSITILAVFTLMIVSVSAAKAQKEPPLPAPIQNMVNEGAQVRYLGQRHGLDGWIAIKGGQEQYFYVTPDGGAFVLGLLFDKDGKLETVRQVQALQDSSEGEALDLYASGGAGQEPAINEFGSPSNRDFKTPAEQLYSDIENSNWVSLGNDSAPVIYTFIDPQCGHCHAFMRDLKSNFIENGMLQVRMIPVGFNDSTRAQAALLLAVPNPTRRWYSHLDGDETALPVSADINQQGVERNLAIMQSWKVNVTPFTVYRNKGGEVKIVQGRVQDVRQLLAELN